jgi:F0F1-type ATP synthase assembly protein I
MIVGALIMIFGLVPPPLLLIRGVISDSQSSQISNAGYIAAGAGAILFIIGVVVGVFGQGAHTDEHAHTAPNVGRG